MSQGETPVTIVGRYTGRTIDTPPSVVDITAPRRGTEKE